MHMGAVPPIGRVRNRRGEGELLRADLLAAASKLLDETGSEDALSLRAVTRAVGAAPQSIYLYFADKQALLWSVYADGWSRVATEMDRAASDAGDEPATRLRALCRAYCEAAKAHPGRFRVLTGATGAAPPNWDSEQELPGARVFSLFRAAVEKALPSEEPTLVATACLIATLNGMLQLHLNRPLFPWPNLTVMTEFAVTRLIGTPSQK